MAQERGLLILSDLRSLNQFLWYYCSFGKDIEWYALCFPSNGSTNYVGQYCEKLGLFKKIFEFPGCVYTDLPLMKQLHLFLKLFLYALLGRQKSFAKKYIETYTESLAFNRFVTLSDIPFMGGVVCLFGDEKEVIILGSGMADYDERKWSKIFNFQGIQYLKGFFLTVLGYANPSVFFPLRTTKSCIKFSEFPEKMQYKKYKNIKKLFDMEYTDTSLYHHFISLLFPSFNDNLFHKSDVLLFTATLSDFVDDVEPYTKLVEDYISSHYKSVLLKRHLRDVVDYKFKETVLTSEIPKEIPSEIFVKFVNNIEIFFVFLSSVQISLQSSEIVPTFFYFPEMRYEPRHNRSSILKYPSLEEFKMKIEEFTPVYKVIELRKKNEG